MSLHYDLSVAAFLNSHQLTGFNRCSEAGGELKQRLAANLIDRVSFRDRADRVFNDAGPQSSDALSQS
jgi:hypothetical protein